MIFARAIFRPDDVNQENVREDRVFPLWNWGGSKPALFSIRGGHSSFWHGKKLLHVASILYIQAKLPVKVNLDYLQVSKNLYIEKLT